MGGSEVQLLTIEHALITKDGRFLSLQQVSDEVNEEGYTTHKGIAPQYTDIIDIHTVVRSTKAPVTTLKEDVSICSLRKGPVRLALLEERQITVFYTLYSVHSVDKS